MGLAERARSKLFSVHWRIASLLPLAARRQYLYLVQQQRYGNFKNPTSFNEKVNWRILHDRRWDLVRCCDKDWMKELARERVPSESELRVPRTLWLGEDIADLPELGSLPPWVLKPNHSSGEVIMGPEVPDDLPERTRAWLRSEPGQLLGEWAYTQARPLLLLEERIPGEQAPTDYKFFCFDGVPHFIQVNQDRFSAPSWTFYDGTWNLLDLTRVGRITKPGPPPPEAEGMLDIASRLSSGFDFMRVDLYAVDSQIWFGEFTPYPNGGLQRFSPRRYDEIFGAPWRIDPEHVMSKEQVANNDD